MSNGTDEVISKVDAMIYKMDRKFNFLIAYIFVWFVLLAVIIVL